MTKKKKPAKRKKADPDLSERGLDEVVGALLKVPPKKKHPKKK